MYFNRHNFFKNIIFIYNRFSLIEKDRNEVMKQMEFHFSFHPLGDNAIIIQLGDEISIAIQQEIQKITSHLDRQPKEWLIEYIPAFTTIAVFYDPLKVPFFPNSGILPYDSVCKELRMMLDKFTMGASNLQTVVEIPVCYGGKFGPDLPLVADHNGITMEEVIHIHSNGNYLVHMIGFAPGFPYIGGMSEKIAAPRRKTPRLKIPARSVGIAGTQTGVYPIETPGGWQLIGRTPLHLFRPYNESPSLLKAGDPIKFKPISYEEFLVLEENIQ